MKYLSLLLIAIGCLLVIPVLADDTCTNASESCVSVSYSDLLTNVALNGSSTNHTNTTAIPRRIDQGGCVELGETVDIAGIGWYTGYITYFGRYYDNIFAGDNLSVVAYEKVDSNELDRFYIDPDYFFDKTGYWYTRYETSAARGNDRLFKIEKTCNATIEYKAALARAFNESQNVTIIGGNLSAMSVRTDPGVDLIIRNNVDTSMDAPQNSHFWIFGNTNGDELYDQPVETTMTYPARILQNYPPGIYDVVFVEAGNNSIVESRYDSDVKAVTSPFKSQPDFNVSGYAPRVVETALFRMSSKSIDDKMTKIAVSIQEPKIEVTKFYQTSLVGNHTMVTLAGYTNANQGTPVTIIFDDDHPDTKYTPKLMKPAIAMNNGGQKAYRTWNASFVYDLNTIAPGEHSITVVDATGGKGKIDIFIRRELPEHYKPDTYLQFVDNNPFIPTPTPEIIVKKEVERVVVTKTVTIPVTPPQDMVTKGQFEAAVAIIMYALVFGAIVSIVVYFAFAFIRRRA